MLSASPVIITFLFSFFPSFVINALLLSYPFSFVPSFSPYILPSFLILPHSFAPFFLYFPCILFFVFIYSFLLFLLPFCYNFPLFLFRLPFLPFPSFVPSLNDPHQFPLFLFLFILPFLPSLPSCSYFLFLFCLLSPLRYQHTFTFFPLSLLFSFPSSFFLTLSLFQVPPSEPLSPFFVKVRSPPP